MVAFYAETSALTYGLCNTGIIFKLTVLIELFQAVSYYTFHHSHTV